MIDDYFRQLDALVGQAAIVRSSTITFDRRSDYVGFVCGILYLLDASQLHFREFVDVQHSVDRYMYSFHYQRADGSLVFRYDNAPHFPDLPTFPHHKHDGSQLNAASTSPADLQTVLTEIRSLIVAARS